MVLAIAATALLAVPNASADVSVQEGGGDWTATGSTCANPSNAISDNDSRALCDSGETVVGRDFDLQSVVPSSATDISFAVIARGRVTDDTGTDVFNVGLSHDGGTSYSPVTPVPTDSVENEFNQQDSNVEAPAAASSSSCAAGSDFGRTWSYSEISDANFRVRVAANPSAASDDMDIDDIDVVVCWAGRFITGASVNGPQANNPGTRDVSLTVDHTLAPGFSAATADNWGSTSYQIEGDATPTCVNVPDPDITDSDTDTRSFAIEPPLTDGTYDVTLRAFRDDACAGPASDPSVISDGITVDSDFPTLHRSSASQTSATFAHTVPSGDNRLLLVAVMVDSVDDATAISYAGNPLTQVAQREPAAGTTDGQQVEIWRLVNPPVGTANVTVTFADAVAYKGVAAANYTGVDQTNPIGASSTPPGGTVGTGPGVGTNGSPTIGLTTTNANSTVVGAAAVGGADTNPFNPAAGITELWDADTGGGSTDPNSDAGLWGGQQPAPTIGLQTLTATPASADDWAMAAVEINPERAEISIDDVTDTEGDTGEKDFSFTISLDQAFTDAVTVDWATANGTATTGDNDYDSISGTATFAPGDTSETVTVKVNGDVTHEPDETFNVNLSGNSANSTIADDQGVGTITNDDPTPSITIDDISAPEGNAGSSNADFTVSLSNPSSQTITVDFDTSDGTAVEPGDYAAHSETVTFNPGDTSETVTVQVNGDLIDEADETFNGDLSNPANATIGDAQGVATITDDDGAPAVSVDDVSQDEGDAGTTNFDFTVSLSHPSAAPVTVDFDTSDGTATVADNDYNAHSQLVTFVPLDTSETVSVTVNGDTTDEPDEVFDVDLSNVSATATIGDGDGDGTIANDDNPAISISDPTVTEGDSGTTNANFDVTLSNESDQTVTVDFDTSDGTATDADNDYEPHSETVTFTGNDTSETVSVAVNGDTADEADEVFHGDLSNETNASIADGQGDATITNDDTPQVSIDNVSDTEGDSGEKDFDFTVSLDRPSAEDVTVDFDTADGTATTADNDYDSNSGTVTFTGGSTAETVTVKVNGDTTDEADEGFDVDLSNASNAAIADGNGDGTIQNDDGDPAISIDNVTDTEGDAGQKDFDFTVSLSNASDQQVTVDYATADGSATTADNDYDSDAGTVTFAPGDTSETVTVDVNGDTTDESDETFDVDLTNNSSNSSIADNQGVGTIQNDDADPAISIGDVSDTEGNTGQKDFDFTVSLSNASDQQITVDYDTADGTATTADGDYDADSGTVTFAPGDTAETVTVKVNGDGTDEADEGFTVDLSNASVNASIDDGQGDGTIQNDDGDPAISIDNVTDTEGDAGQKDFDFTVSLSNPSSQTITVDFATADDTATTADGDYDSATGTVTFNPGDISETVTVDVNGDTADEADETFNVDLTNNAPDSTIADGTGVGTITNDDVPQISIDDVAVTEGNAGQTAANFTVELDRTSTDSVTVDWATANGTATLADGDYDQADDTVTFAPGDTEETVTVQVNGDTTDENDETFDVNLSNASANSSILDDQGTGTINDDDDPPDVNIDDVVVTEGNAGQTPATFTATLSAASGKTVTVDFAPADDDATVADGDFAATGGTLTFAPDDTSETATVQVNGDTKHEDDEEFQNILSNPNNADLDDETGVGTIENDDAEPEISIDDVALLEGDSGNTVFVFSADLSNASSEPVTVDFDTANGTAAAPADYDTASGTVTFNSGDTTEPVTVQVNGDVDDEPDETFNVDLSNASANSSIDDGQGLGTILDDDAAIPPVVPGPSGDGEAPNTTITGGPKAKTKKKKTTFTFTGSDARAVTGFECKVDGGSFQPCTSPLSLKVKKGTHTFQVRAVDGAGNVDPTPATQSWKVKKKKRKK